MPVASPKSNQSRLYPIGLLLHGKRCLVVGTGPLARKKADELRDCGARVDAIATEFEPSDLAGAHLVVVAGAGPELQERVAQAAEARGIPCNVLDVNHLCTFYAPAVLRRGALTISVATEGKSPLLAVAVRDRIAETLPDAVGPALELLDEGRRLARARYPDDFEARVAALRALLSPAAFESIVAGHFVEFERHWESWKTELSAKA